MEGYTTNIIEGGKERKKIMGKARHSKSSTTIVEPGTINLIEPGSKSLAVPGFTSLVVPGSARLLVPGTKSLVGLAYYS